MRHKSKLKKKEIKENLIKEKTKLKGQNGITLIALVITIIVLLILAAVSIATLTGENGILTRANEAKTETEEAKEDELRKLTALEAATNLEDTTYIDNSTGEEKTITIPAETAVSQVEGENTLEDGLVIIDKNGNEWVWIEVPKNIMPENLTFENEQDYITLETALQQYTTTYRDTEFIDEWYNGCGLEQEEYTTLKQNMLKSIYKNLGFYIGRYEVGSFDNPVTANDTTRKAVMQKGAYPYNWITCSQAQEISEKILDNQNINALMFGLQWDLTLKYIEMNGDWDTSNHEASYYLAEDSSSWGNYRNVEFPILQGTKFAIFNDGYLSEWDETEDNNKPLYNLPNTGMLLSTGANKRNSKMNIYDLSGNLYEYTLEKNTNVDTPCVFRGGYYAGPGYYAPTSYRNYENNNIIDSYYSSAQIGFRCTLILNN